MLEHKMLAFLLKHPHLIKNVDPMMFTSNNRALYETMELAYNNIGSLTIDSWKLYCKNIPAEVIAHYSVLNGDDSRFSSYYNTLYDSYLRRSLEGAIDSLKLLKQKNTALDPSDIKSVLMSLPDSKSSNDSSIKSGIREFVDDLNKKREGSYSFVSTGIPQVDFNIGGEYIRNGLTLLTGFPGSGKTSFVMYSMLQMARKGIPSLIVSLEMSKLKLIMRLVSTISGIDSTTIQLGKISTDDQEKIDKAITELQSIPLYIIDNNVTIEQVATEVKSHKLKYGIEAVFIDYIQIMSTKLHANASDPERYGYFAKELVSIAKANDIAVIALSQKNRTGVGLESILGSSRPGHISDLVMNVSLEETDIDIKPATFEIYKNKNGKVGKFILLFDGSTVSFN